MTFCITMHGVQVFTDGRWMFIDSDRGGTATTIGDLRDIIESRFRIVCRDPDSGKEFPALINYDNVLIISEVVE